MTSKNKIAVLLGGVSSERDVSIASGAQVFKALQTLGYEVIAVDTAQGVLDAKAEQQLLTHGVAELPPSSARLNDLQIDYPSLLEALKLQSCDLFFLALHGGDGEDGRLQALLDLQGLAYTGSDSRGCNLAMDKAISKQLFLHAGVTTADWLMAPCNSDEVEKHLGFPVVVKPNKEGSTVGLTVVREPEKLSDAIAYASQYDDEVMVEAFIPGRELTVGIMDGQALEVGEIIVENSEIFDYSSKYQKGGAKEVFPADLDPELRAHIQAQGLLAHQVLKLGGYSRVDFRLNEAGELYCLEANALPGLTATSLLPQSAAAVGIDFQNLCTRICELALQPT